ncbi:MAG: DNA polymerase III subunit delta' [Tepidisphaeraceae bacterium]|jgi:DNA polymerase-3 subunit delta'
MKRLRDILGQESAVDSLRRAMATDRLGHGLIFTGPSGVGKATTAAALSAWFLCEKPGESDSCGKCESCRAVAALAHPDYHIITKELARVHDKSGTSKATALAINVVRYELAAKAAQKSVLGRGKVFIVEEAHLMTPAAQNALLKTLEEPAGRTLIILLTDHLDDLLPTVRSRCQLVRFGRLENAIVQKELLARGIEKEIAAAATELADGSLGLALRWIEDELLKSVQAVAEEVDAVMAGRSAFDLIEVVKKSAEAQVERLLKRDELTSKDAAMRSSLGDYLSIAAQRLRHRLTETEDPEALEQNCRAIDALAQAEKYLAANVNVSLVLEQLGMSIR